ncbi:MAG TPA: TolC family protein [Polyangiaceae bacterium]|nr:TolC family protein [Polyangiaceae bacterium]
MRSLKLASVVLLVSYPSFAQQPPEPDILREAPKREGPDELAYALAAQPGGLTAARTAQRVVRASTDVRSRLADLESARAKVWQTTVAFVPRLTLKASYTRLSPVESSFGSGALVGASSEGPITTGPCPPGLPAAECVLDAAGQPVGAFALTIPSVLDNFALSAQLLVPLSDYALRLPDAVEGVGQAEAGAEQGIEAARARGALEGRLLYYGWIRAVGQQSITNQALARANGSLGDATAAHQVGRITRADLMRVQTLVKTTEQLAEDAGAMREMAERQLAVMMGDPPATRYRVGENVMVAPALPPLDERALVREAYKLRTDLKSLDHTIRAVEASGGLARGAYYPRVDAFGELTYANPNQRFFPPTEQWRATWLVGLSATWTINDTVATAGASREIEAQIEKLRATREALRRGVRLEVSGAILEARRAQRSIETAEAALASAEEAHRVQVELYRVGQATTTDLLAAESELLRARLGQLSAFIDARVARAKLHHAVGRTWGRLR